jgi:hypothetical protein
MTRLLAISLLFIASTLNAQVLPEDQLDVSYRYYEGGDVDVQGPAVLVRKGFKDTFSVKAAYKVDEVSSASIDVMSYASPYDERREEYEIGGSAVWNDALISASYSTSTESDYEADTYHFNYEQTLFGEMTTLSLGYTRGEDEVGKNGEPGFSEDVRRNQYRLGISQVITRNSIVSLNTESISDEGFLGSPYRFVAVGGALRPEQLPRTRTSTATALSGLYYFEGPGSSVKATYRYFSDTWDITAHTLEAQYSQPWRRFLFDVRYRFYTQDAASFYADYHQRPQNYMARDKELSTFVSHSLGMEAAYELPDFWLMEKPSLHLSADVMRFEYDDFYQYGDGQGVGALLLQDLSQREVYDFTALVMQLYFSTRF